MSTPLDRLLQPGRVSVLAGRPAMGRTTLALNLALEIAGRDVGQALYFNADPEPDRTRSRLEGILSGERAPLLREVTAPPPLPFRMWQHRTLSIDAVVDAAEGALAEGPVALVVVDWIQLVWSHPYELNTKIDRPARVFSALRELAASTGAAVLALSHLPRWIEERGDHRPRRVDLTGVDVDPGWAHTCAALYRDVYYQLAPAPADPADEVAELLIWSADDAPEVVRFGFDAPVGRTRWL